jgi:hypothetical protein
MRFASLKKAAAVFLSVFMVGFFWVFPIVIVLAP